MAQTPWWSNIISLSNIIYLVIGGIIGVLLKVLYDLKIYPAIKKYLRNKEKIETEEEERQKRAREEKINNFNREWREGRKILSNLKQPLREFNQMDRLPDKYTAPKCLELALLIEREAEKITWLKFQSIRDKLLEYARRKDQIDQNTPLHILKNIFQRLVEPNKYEPLALCEEIDKVLRASSTPPFSEEEIGSK